MAEHGHGGHDNNAAAGHRVRREPPLHPTPPPPEVVDNRPKVVITAKPLEGVFTTFEKKRINRANMAIAVGGEALSDHGQLVEVEGIAERALKSVGDELAGFDQRREFFQEEVAENKPDHGSRRFLGLFKQRPKAEVSARADIQTKAKEHQAANTPLQKELLERSAEITQLISENKVTGHTLGIWDDLTVIDAYLKQNPYTNDFAQLDRQLKSLNVDLAERARNQGVSPYQFLELLVDDSKITSPGFSEFLGLNHQRNSLRERLDEQVVAQKAEMEGLNAPLAQTREKNRLLKQDETNLKLAAAKRAEIKADYDAIDRAQQFVKDVYLIKDDEINTVTDAMDKNHALRDDVQQTFTRAIELTNEVRALNGEPTDVNFQTTELKQLLEANKQKLDAQLQVLAKKHADIFDLRKRLENAPPELKAALEFVSRPGFKLKDLPRYQRRIILLDNVAAGKFPFMHSASGSETYITALVEMAAVLLGKDQVDVREKGVEPSATIINTRTDATELSQQAEIAPKKVVQAILDDEVDSLELSRISAPLDYSDPIYQHNVRNRSTPDELKQVLKTKAQTEHLSNQDIEAYIYKLFILASQDMYLAILRADPSMQYRSINIVDPQALGSLCRDLGFDPHRIELTLNLNDLLRNLLKIGKEVSAIGLPRT